jgi:hypothetical protein
LRAAASVIFKSHPRQCCYCPGRPSNQVIAASGNYKRPKEIQSIFEQPMLQNAFNKQNDLQ